LIEREESTPVSVRRQCELLFCSRSGFYYEPAPVSPEDQAVMNLIDEIYTKWPFYGARRMSRELKSRGSFVGRKHAGRLMRLMGLEAIFPKKNTSKPYPGHPRLRDDSRRRGGAQRIPRFLQPAAAPSIA